MPSQAQVSKQPPRQISQQQINWGLNREQQSSSHDISGLGRNIGHAFLRHDQLVRVAI